MHCLGVRLSTEQGSDKYLLERWRLQGTSSSQWCSSPDSFYFWPNCHIIMLHWIRPHFLLMEKALNFALHFLQKEDFYLGAGRHRKADVCGCLLQALWSEREGVYKGVIIRDDVSRQAGTSWTWPHSSPPGQPQEHRNSALSTQAIFQYKEAQGSFHLSFIFCTQWESDRQGCSFLPLLLF